MFRYSEKISIKRIGNGWLVHYNERNFDKGEERDVTREFEKAFTYDFDDEVLRAWKELAKFVASKFVTDVILEQIYPEEKKK